MTTDSAQSLRPALILRLLPVGAALLLLAAGCSNDGPNLGVPTGGNLPGPGDIGDGAGEEGLRQQIRFDGEFMAELRLEGSWDADGPGQDVTVTFVAEGLTGVKQFEFLVAPSPAGAFDLEGASFATDSPFITLPGGVRREDNGRLRMGGASLANPVDGTHTLGTLTLATSSSYNTFSEARLNVVRVSVGPTSTQRDTYEGDSLRLGVEVR